MNRNIESQIFTDFCETVTFKEIERIAQIGKRLAVYQILQADLLTPSMVYLRLRKKGSVSFLFESVIRGEQIGRYSFIGINPQKVLKIENGFSQKHDFFEQLQKELNQQPLIPQNGLPRFKGGAVGYLGFDVVQMIETLPPPKPDPLQIPDALLAIYDQIIAFDHVTNRVFLIQLIKVENIGTLKAEYLEAIEKLDELRHQILHSEAHHLGHFTAKERRFASNFSKEGFAAAVNKAIDHIYAGDIFQVVLSQRFSLPYRGDAFQVYRALRSINPSPYMFFIDFGEFQLLGTSPEPLIRLEQGQIEIIPIAGTRPRGASEIEDENLAHELLNDPKERAEHIMLVDLARNDVGRVARAGTVQVNDLLTIERYSHVMHIISRVNGNINPQYSAVDAFKSAFPAGTVSGTPKIRAMEIINDLEPVKRSFYAGAVGYFDYSGNMDMCIAIRTMLAKDGMLYWQAGAGIVADSIPENEFNETLNKGRALFKAIQKASGART